MKKRLLEFLAYLKIGQKQFEIKTGLSNGYVDKLGENITMKSINKIEKAYPELSTSWLLTGEGEMLKSGVEIASMKEESNCTYLLPLYAAGGSLNDFVVSVKKSDCEKIVSPIKGADWAITVSGDSMAPEYPAGAMILIKMINERAFIEWGKVYVLDTCNGTVVKILEPSEEEGKVRCVSINPDPRYAPFDVSYENIFGVYKILMCMSVK